MKVYRVALACRVVDESNPPRDEFFETSEPKARKLAKKIMKADADADVYGVEIEQVYFAEMTTKSLIMAILNGAGYVEKRVPVASWERVGGKFKAS